MDIHTKEIDNLFEEEMKNNPSDSERVVIFILLLPLIFPTV